MIDPKPRLCGRASGGSGNIRQRRRPARRLGEELYERKSIRRGHRGVPRRPEKAFFEHDPTLAVGLGTGRNSASRTTRLHARQLELLAQQNPDFKSADAQLLYARTLDAHGALDEAEREYATLAPGFPGGRSTPCGTGYCSSGAASCKEAQRVLKDLFGWRQN